MRDIKIKNKLTVTKGKWKGIMGGKGRSLFRNMYKGHMDKAKGGVGSRVGGRDGWGRGKW